MDRRRELSQKEFADLRKRGRATVSHSGKAWLLKRDRLTGRAVYEEVYVAPATSVAPQG